MSQQHTLGKGNTKVSNDGKHTIMTYHKTEIIKFNDKETILNNGGWLTASTKTRLNQGSNQFNLGYSVSQEKYLWYVTYKGKTIEFSNGMKLKR